MVPDVRSVGPRVRFISGLGAPHAVRGVYLLHTRLVVHLVPTAVKLLLLAHPTLHCKTDGGFLGVSHTECVYLSGLQGGI